MQKKNKISQSILFLIKSVSCIYLESLHQVGEGKRRGGGGEGRYFYPNNLNTTVLSPSNEQQQLYLYSTLNLYDTTNIYITQKMKRVQAVHNNH